MTDGTIFVRRLHNLPLTVRGVTTPNPDGTFSVYINAALPPEVQDRVIYSPHLGGNTGGSFRRAHANMWNNARLIQEGKRPNFVVNGL